MIYYDDDLGSVIESVYLREGLDEHLSVSNIVVNPSNPQYIFAKTIILNDPTYKDGNLLLEHNCKVISRIEGLPGDYQPYIIRPDLQVMWNGEEIFSELPYSELCKIILEDHIKYDDGKLFFPKVYHSGIILGSGLSWVLHQVGINYFPGKFQDLDIIKLYKKGVS